MMCNHKWDIKKTANRPIFDFLTTRFMEAGHIILSGSLGLISMSILYQTEILRFNRESFTNLTDYYASYVGAWGGLTFVYIIISMVIICSLKRLMAPQDKICLKCHLTIFEATEYAERAKIVETKRVRREGERAKIKEQKEDERREISVTAHKVFETRRTMRKKAQI